MNRRKRALQLHQVNAHYLLHIYTMFLLHVSVYLTPSSGSSLLKNTCFYAVLSMAQWLRGEIYNVHTTLLVYITFNNG